MTELLTAAQMRAIELAAIDSGEVTGLELMERAGKGVVEAIFEEWPELATAGRPWYNFWEPKPRAVVFCGPGNNGGDGFVIARLLKRTGWRVTVFHLFPKDGKRPPPDAYQNAKAWLKLGKLHHFTADKNRDPLLSNHHPHLWIDAIFGIGQTRALPDLVTQMLGRVYYEQNWSTAPVVCVDIPTGINSDTGNAVQSFFLKSDLTVTFHKAKVGHFKADGPTKCGKVVVKDIGLAKWDAARHSA